jgi:NitT/TauT family transport system substrate-binding protein
LPEPKVTVVKSQNDSVKTALDLTAEWDKVATPGTLIQSCVIIRKEFADNNPEAVKAFLEEYKTSVNYVNSDPQAAADLIAQAGIIPKAPLALKAIPGSNIKYMDGSEMKASLSEFYNILYSVEPKSIGGKLPYASLYYDASTVQTSGTADKSLNVNVTVLSGTTGMGMAKLMADAKAGNAALSYNFNVISDPTQINA